MKVETKKVNLKDYGRNNASESLKKIIGSNGEEMYKFDPEAAVENVVRFLMNMDASVKQIEKPFPLFDGLNVFDLMMAPTEIAKHCSLEFQTLCRKKAEKMQKDLEERVKNMEDEE